MNSGEKQTETLSHLILGRRTRKPKNFKDGPTPNQVKKLIDIARHAPNHHRTQPARFYLLDKDKIKHVARLFGEVVQGDKSSQALVERGKKKEQEWSMTPGLLIVTCHTDKDSELVRLNPDVIEEDYATCCCICQNILLLFEAEGISSKWSTGKVWEHPEFANCVGITKPSMERVVALLFYGYSDDKIPNRSLANISEHLRDYTSA
jgi:nitroreductase